jgi:hypothetical protein
VGVVVKGAEMHRHHPLPRAQPLTLIAYIQPPSARLELCEVGITFQLRTVRAWLMDTNGILFNLPIL